MWRQEEQTFKVVTLIEHQRAAKQEASTSLSLRPSLVQMPHFAHIPYSACTHTHNTLTYSTHTHTTLYTHTHTKGMCCYPWLAVLFHATLLCHTTAATPSFSLPCVLSPSVLLSVVFQQLHLLDQRACETPGSLGGSGLVFSSPQVLLTRAQAGWSPLQIQTALSLLSPPV